MSNGLPILAEHEAPDFEDTAKTDHPDMTEEQEQTVKLVNKLFDKAKKHRSMYDRKWIDNYRFFRGDQWKRRRPSYRHSEVVNLVFQAIQGMVPIMTDARPKSNFSPQDPSDLEFTEYLNQLYEADWQDGGWLMKIAEMLYDGHFYGIGYGKLEHNPDAEFGLGRIEMNTADPFDQYPDPAAIDVNCDKTSHYWVEAKPMELEKVRSKYANHPFRGVIRADLGEMGKGRMKTSVNREQFVRLTDRKMPHEEFGEDADQLAEKVLVVTCYMKPSDVVEEQQEKQNDDGSKEVVFVKRKRWPNGRKIVIINDYVFEDQDHLDNQDGKFPYARYVNYLLPREFYGMSEIEQLEGPQQIFNKLVSFTLDVMTLMGNPIWLIPTSSGVKPGSFHSAPGMQVPYDGPTPPSRQDGAQLQPYVLQMIDRMENWFNGVSGSTEVSRGVNPGSVTAASAIESLQDAAQTRTRQKMRNMDKMLVDMGNQWVQLALQHYTAPRVFRLTGKDGAQRYFKFHVEHAYEKDPLGNYVLDEHGERIPKRDDKGDPVKFAHVTDYIEDESTGKMIEDIEGTKKWLIRGAFDVKVETTSGLPFKKAEKENRLLQLYDRQIIDRRTFLKEIEFPSWEKIADEMETKEQQMAQQQAAGG